MNATLVDAPKALEPIKLSELKESTKDFLLAVSLQDGGKTTKEAIEQVLDEAASRSGFSPEKAA
jgi:hypothetical protein